MFCPQSWLSTQPRGLPACKHLGFFTLGCALLYGTNNSWKVTGWRVFLSSFLMETEAWSSQVIYLRTFCCYKDREEIKFMSSWLLVSLFPRIQSWLLLKYVNMHYSNVQTTDSETVRANSSCLSLSDHLELSPASTTSRRCVLEQHPPHFGFPVGKLKIVIVPWRYGKH